MNRFPRIVLMALLVALVLGCSQLYYTKSFRLSTEKPSDTMDFGRLIDGPLGEFGNSRLFLRVVAVYETNNKARLNQNSFNVMLEQRLPKGMIDTILVDSVTFTLLPSGEKLVLPRQKVTLYNGDYSPQPRIRSSFGSVPISPSVDTILVHFVARGRKNDQAEETKVYGLTMIRFEGTTEKFGVQPKDD